MPEASSSLTDETLTIRIQVLRVGADQAVAGFAAALIAERLGMRCNVELVVLEGAPDKSWGVVDGLLFSVQGKDFVNSEVHRRLGLPVLQQLLHEKLGDLLAGSLSRERATLVSAYDTLRSHAADSYVSFATTGSWQSTAFTDFNSACGELKGWLPGWIERRF